MRAIFQIALNTWREILREPVYLLILASALILIALLPMFTLFVFREQVKMVVDAALATVMVFGWVLAVLCAANAITREIDRGTAVAVLVKPVPRWSFIVGKTVGIFAALLFFWLLATMASLVSVRAATDQFRFDQAAVLISFGCLAAACAFGGWRNFSSRASFAMNAVVAMLPLYALGMLVVVLLGAEGEARLTYAWNIVPAFVLLLYAVWAMGALAVAFSTRLPLLVNLNLCAVVFILGLMSDYLLGRFAESSLLAALAYAAVPNWQLLWLADALAAGRTIPSAYLVWGTIYMLCLVGLFVGFAIFLFEDREVGLQNVR